MTTENRISYVRRKSSRARNDIKSDRNPNFQTRFNEKLYQQFDERAKNAQKKQLNRNERSNPGIIKNHKDAKGVVEDRLIENDLAIKETFEKGLEMISNIRIAHEKRLEQRRLIEHKEEDEIADILQKESIATKSKLETICDRWKELQVDDKSAVQIAELLVKQKERIASVIQEKDFVIEKLRDDLKHTTAIYEDFMDKQFNDSFFVMQRMTNYLNQLRKIYANNMNLLYNTLEDERDNLYYNNNLRWNEASNKMAESTEMKQKTEKQKMEFLENELERIRIAHLERTRAIRIRMENEFDGVQLELQNIKEDTLKNCEKFDYNYEILQKKCDENIFIKNQEKRRLARLREQILKINKQIRETKDQFEEESKQLVKDIIRHHSSFLELEERADRHAVINNQKFEQIWNLNYEEANQLLDKVLAIDRVLYEQQLGLDWKKPLFIVNDITYLKSYRLARDLLYPNEAHKQGPKTLKELSQSEIRANRKQKVGFGPTKKENVADNRIVRLIFRKLGGETGFLLDSHLQEILKDEKFDVCCAKSLIKLNVVFKALGIYHLKDISSLIDYLLPFAWCPNCESRDTSSIGWIQRRATLEFEGNLSVENSIMDLTSVQMQPLDSIVADISNLELYSVDAVLAEYIRNYSTEYQFNKAVKNLFPKQSSESIIPKSETCKQHYLVIETSIILKNLQQFVQNYLNQTYEGEPVTTMNDRLTKVRQTMTRLISEDDIKIFWEQFGRVFDADRQRLWGCLEQGLAKYLKILQKRDRLDTECEYLRRQNAELKHLLSQYTTPAEKQKGKDYSQKDILMKIQRAEKKVEFGKKKNTK